MIIAHSPNKSDFKKPQNILHELYNPKLIKLEAHEFAFVDKVEAGQILLDDI